MKPRLDPFGLAEGRLQLDGVDLADVADGLQGKPAWVISGAAVLEALELARAGRRAGGRAGARTSGGGERAVCVEVGAIGPPAVLALIAQADAWASVASGHELTLALKAGFAPRRIVVQAPVLDDGFILEALTARVGVLVRRGGEEAARLTRIARSLKLPLPKPAAAPPCLRAAAFARCGGLLARLLSGPPRLVLDALWDSPSSSVRGARSTTQARLVLPVAAPSATRARVATLGGLTTVRPTAARLLGEGARGDWVLVPDPAAVAVHAPHPAWPQPRAVLVMGGVWRELDARPLPPSE